MNLELLDWYRDGDLWVALDAPLDGYVRIGVGASQKEAARNLEETPIPCVGSGRDYRTRALSWAARNVAWISEGVTDADDGLPALR